MLELPSGACIHNVFHVGILKPFWGTPPAMPPALPPLRHGRRLQQPARALRAQLRRGTWHVLIQWATLPEEEATWEPLDEFRAEFPAFHLEDELFVEGGSDVMVGKVYQRRNKKSG